MHLKVKRHGGVELEQMIRLCLTTKDVPETASQANMPGSAFTTVRHLKDT